MNKKYNCINCGFKIGIKGLCYECQLPPHERRALREARELRGILAYKKRLARA